MSPTRRVALVLALLAGLALVVPVPAVALAGVALAVATACDAASVRTGPPVRRQVPTVLARGVAAPLVITTDDDRARVRVRQPATPDLEVEPAEGDQSLRGTVTPRRRGRHLLPAPVTRTAGPLGLARWDHRVVDHVEVVVYPDLPAARRLAVAVRQGRFRHEGRRSRGPLGLGTEFESVRDYVPDDDVRQVNWRATARVGRPMSNQYRVEQDRDVICVVDTGRLMSSPAGNRTRLDMALDAVTGVALVADELGDRCGVMAFDAEVRRHLTPRRSGGTGVVEAVFDLEPRPLDSDYELAFRTVGAAKRAFVIVLTDLVEEGAARPLVDAVPFLARRHALAVATATDPDLEALLTTPPSVPLDVYRAAAAADVLDARVRVGTQLRRAGAQVVEAPPDRLTAACVAAYLRTKAMARL